MKDMGSINRAFCECGFRTTVRVGGNMTTHNENSSFPFYCKKCGIVNMNIHGNITECQFAWCKSTDIHPYGKEPISKVTERYPAIEWGDYKAYHNGNLCPECKKFTLKFGGPEMMFD